jgi:hypothetical protein
MVLVLDVSLMVFHYLLLRVFSVYLSLFSMYMTMSISIGLYANLDLWNANKLHYITVILFTNILTLRCISFPCPFYNPTHALIVKRVWQHARCDMKRKFSLV